VAVTLAAEEGDMVEVTETQTDTKAAEEGDTVVKEVMEVDKVAGIACPTLVQVFRSKAGT